jgi:acetyl esterase/lipase
VALAASLFAACASLVVAGPAGDARAQQISVQRKVPYVEGGTRHQVMDVYIPDGDGPFPGVVVIHGGGWQSGNTGKFKPEALFLAQRGFVAFSVTYRKAPEFTFPAQVEDVQAAVRFIRDHADEFKVRAEQLGALGGSAGGQLAAMLGVRGEGPTNRDSRVNVVVSWSGPMNFTQAPSGQVAPQIPRRRGPLQTYLGCSPLVCPETYVDASPVTHVDPTDAPMLLANSANEQATALSHAEDMAAALQEAEVPVELIVLEGQLHSKAYANEPAPGHGGQTVFEASADFMREWIDGRGQTEPPPTTSPPRAGPPPSGGRLPLLVIIAAIVALAALAIALPLLRRRRY